MLINLTAYKCDLVRFPRKMDNNFLKYILNKNLKMKNENKNIDKEQITTGANSNPENKFKENSKPATAESINNIIKSPVASAKAKSGDSLFNEGTNVDYNEEE